MYTYTYAGQDKWFIYDVTDSDPKTDRHPKNFRGYLVAPKDIAINKLEELLEEHIAKLKN